MTDTTLLYDGPDLRIYQIMSDESVSVNIQKLGSTESIQLTHEQLKEIWPVLQGWYGSTFGDQGGYES